LLTALLTACLNPISVNFPENTSGNVTLPSQKTPDRGISPGIPGGEPFTLDVWVDDTARGIAGPASDQIKYAGIRNIINLVVVDAVTGAIANCQEVRKENEADLNATLVVTGLTYGKTYKFLMLTGHKERNYAAEGSTGNYVYYADKPPTLLAAGYTSQSVSRGQKIPITLYPVVVDTTFTDETTTEDAVLGDILPLEAGGSWGIAWEVTGLQALKAAAPGGIFKEARTIVRGEDINDAQWASISPLPDVTEQGVMEITHDVSTYTVMNRLGKQNSASFNVDYVPFQDFTWENYTAPEWIIRNGINDEPQDANTSFASGVSWGTDPAEKNGNGAVNFTANSGSIYVSNTGNDSTGDGSRVNPFAALTKAYTAALDSPAIRTITVLSDLDAGNSPMTLDGGGTPPEITITSDTGQWTLTRTNGANDSVVEVSGGAKVVFSNIKITGGENRALYIMGPDNMVTLNNTALTGKAQLGGGVYLYNNDGHYSLGGYSGDWIPDPPSKITMNGGTISGESTDSGGGVYLFGRSAEFDMKSGTVSGTAARDGGGVYVTYNATFTMEDGTVSESSASYAGGGVWLGSSAQFTMSGNDAINGGGVWLGSGAYFTMSGNAAVSGNDATYDGGGVYVESAWQFTMSGSSIIYGADESEDLKNTAASTGAAILIQNLSPYKVPAYDGGNYNSFDKDDIVYAEAWNTWLSGLEQF
jgi:hypothetical protein